MRRLPALLLACILLCMAVPAGAESTLVIHQLRLGVCEAYVIACDGDTLLVDAGSKAQAELLLVRLLALGVSAFDGIVITRDTHSRIGGLGTLLKVYDADAIYTPDHGTDVSDCYRYAALTAGKRGMTLTPLAQDGALPLGDAQVSILAGDGGLTLRVDHGAVSLFLPATSDNRLPDGQDARSFASDGVSLITIGIHGQDDRP